MIRWDDAGGRALQEEMPASESGLVWDIWIMHLHIYIFILIRLLFFIAFLKFNHSNDSYSNSYSYSYSGIRLLLQREEKKMSRPLRLRSTGR